jgi:hypothetical protein
MWPFSDPLADARHAVRSPDVQQRGYALERLLDAARRTPRLRADALALFLAFLDARLREGAACEEHPWPICAAGRGVQALGGSTVMHGVWHALLAHPRSQVVETAALMVPELPDAAAYAPTLCALADGHADLKVRYTAACALGQCGDPGATPALIALFDAPDWKPHAITSLGQYGDARAVPALEALRDDQFVPWPEGDAHAPGLRICDLAEDALAMLARRPLPRR